jgi:hypothetical protein
MKQTLSFFGCKQPYFGTSFVAGGDFVLNTCNKGAKGMYFYRLFGKGRIYTNGKIIKE